MVMNPKTDTTTLETADTEMSQKLIREADSWVDLNRAGDETLVLMSHLADRFGEVNESFVASTSADSANLQGVFKLLARQLARAQADIFALKALILGRDKMILTKDWDYCDPLAAHARAFTQDGLQGLWDNIGYYNLPIDDALMGFGWYSHESNERATWRWSGPGTKATLLVPRFYSGKINLEISFSSVRRGVMPETGGIIIAKQPIDYKLYFPNNTTTHGKLSCTVNLNANDVLSDASFLPIEFHLTRTYSPSTELGRLDKRELGICIHSIRLSTSNDEQ